MIENIVLWMGHHFSAQQYLLWTRVECAAWTAADIMMVFSLLRLADLARRITQKEPHRISYAIVAATLFPAIGILFVPTGSLIFLLEIVVTIPHFLIILYLLGVDATRFATAWAMLHTRHHG